MELYDPKKTASIATNTLLEHIVRDLNDRFEDVETRCDILKWLGEGLICTVLQWIVEEDRHKLIEPFANDLKENMVKMMVLLQKAKNDPDTF